MAYITNESGQIKVITAKGRTKFVSKLIAENEKIMRNTGLTIVESPEKYEPLKFVVDEPETDFEPETIVTKKTNKRK